MRHTIELFVNVQLCCIEKKNKTRLSYRRYRNHIRCFGLFTADVNWYYVFSVSVVHILTPPMLLQHPGMGSKF